MVGTRNDTYVGSQTLAAPHHTTPHTAPHHTLSGPPTSSHGLGSNLFVFLPWSKITHTGSRDLLELLLRENEPFIIGFDFSLPRIIRPSDVIVLKSTPFSYYPIVIQLHCFFFCFFFPLFFSISFFSSPTYLVTLMYGVRLISLP